MLHLRLAVGVFMQNLCANGAEGILDLGHIFIEENVVVDAGAIFRRHNIVVVIAIVARRQRDGRAGRYVNVNMGLSGG